MVNQKTAITRHLNHVSSKWLNTQYALKVLFLSKSSVIADTIKTIHTQYRYIDTATVQI